MQPEFHFYEFLGYAFAELLALWQVWLAAVLFGAVSVSALRACRPLPISNRSFSYHMTFLNFVYVSILVGYLGPYLLISSNPHLGVNAVTLFRFVGFGALFRIALQFIPYPTPNPRAAAQAVFQLGILAFDFSHGTAYLWPGWVLFLAIAIGGIAFIAMVEAIITAAKPTNATTVTVAISGFLVVLPMLAYASWVRVANLDHGLLWEQ